MSPKRMPLPLHENAERSAPISGSVPASGVRPLRIPPLSIVQRVAERPEPQRAPTELGRYTVLREVASGGMATVYVGRQTGAAGFERIVAIKCCHERLRANDDFASMFLEEARLAARIRHPNVVATLDVSDGVPLYLVMEYVEGESVASLMRAAATRGQRLPLDVSLSVMIDALSGLQAAHECRGPDGRPLGLVHCDVSPQNILVGVDGTARITDFGIARAATHVASDRNVIEGKLSYLAPEQLSSEAVTQRADVFSAGVVLWELLAGRPLFSGDSDAATICAVLSHVPATPSSFDATIPRALDAIVLRALARDPAARFGSAAEFLTALERLAIGRATARGVGEYVRRSADVTAVPPESGSGEYRSVANDARNTETRVWAAEVELLARLGAPRVEAATRVVEVPPELVAATRRPASMSLDAGTARRLIAAITLVLVGCAVGLLVATSGAPPARASTGATTSQPANAAPLAAPR